VILRFRKITSVTILALAAATACVGCGDGSEMVLETRAIDQIHTLVVVPLAGEGDPSVGPVLSGLMVSRLEGLRRDQFSVVEAPAIWRLAATPTSQPSLTDQAALEVARKMGAQAVLTGSAVYTCELDASGVKYVPKAGKDELEHMEFLKNFAARKGQIKVEVRVLLTDGGRPVYAYSASKQGQCDAEQLRFVAEKAVEPLEKYLEKSRGKRKD
jgi:hypothetical protein